MAGVHFWKSMNGLGEDYSTLESIRRTQLQERYALLWVATALVMERALDLFP